MKEIQKLIRLVAKKVILIEDGLEFNSKDYSKRQLHELLKDIVHIGQTLPKLLKE